MKKLILAFTLLPLVSIIAQTESQSVSIMYYNLLNFPSSTSDRADTLEKIIRHVEPDLFLVNELETNYGANLILSNAMNTQGVTHFSKATFYNGPDTDNMLFYNNEKFGLVSQNQISTVTRDISEYKVYFKEPNLSATSDTIYLYLYSCHLKAGTFQSDIDDRESEATTFKNYLQSQGITGNIALGGDFNFYESSEPGCQMILNGGSMNLNDPINQLGSWNSNSFYAPYHTQSTRSSSGGYAGGSSGGMDDRFDFIFISDAIKNGTDRVSFVGGSYTAIGQDGFHYNQSVNSGFNQAVPADVADALFYMSDHLPVYMEMSIEYPVGIQYLQEVISGYHFINENQLQLTLKENSALLQVEIFNLSGQLVESLSDGNSLIDISTLSNGVYLLKAVTDKGEATVKFVKE